VNASKYLNLLKSLNQGKYHENSNNSERNPTVDTDDGTTTTAIATMSPTTSMTDCAISWILERVRSSYRERLETFANPSTYFAKPIDISPLVCARFGWSNTAPNVLTCSNNTSNGTHNGSGGRNCCNAVLYVKFHPNLSPQSHATLARTYRTLLAKSHSESCPFRADAERWLITLDTNNDNDNDNDGRNDNVGEHPTTKAGSHGENRSETPSPSSPFVPPYLLSMSREFTVFEDCSTVGFIARELVRKEATTLGIAMKILESDGGAGAVGGGRPTTRRGILWRASVPYEVVDRCCFDGEGDAVAPQEFVQEQLMACLVVGTEGRTSHDDGESAAPPPPTTTEHDDAAHDRCSYMRNEAALLAAFGWRFEPWPSSSTTVPTSNVLRVGCRLCLASAPVPWCWKEVSDDGGDDEGALGTTATDADGDDGTGRNTHTADECSGESTAAVQQPPLKKRRCDDRNALTTFSNSVGVQHPPPNLSVLDTDEIEKGDGEGVDSSSGSNVASFDVVGSHRHFCPYVSGFASYRQKEGRRPGETPNGTDDFVTPGSTTKPVAGWERVVDALMRPRRGLIEDQGDEECTTLEERSIAREETFQMLRRALHS